jgi:excisionase family DNA binding protein
MTTDDFILAQEVSDFLSLDLATIYQMARSGELPGAIWGETLHFELEEFTKWWESVIDKEIDKKLRELEEDGLLMSFVDSDGRRCYVAMTGTTLQ